LGCVASVTSASTIDVDPCITSSASWAEGCPLHDTDMAAHVGTAGNDEGTVNGDGLGVGLGEGGGEGESDVEGDGLVRTATVGADPQPDTTITVASASSPTLRLTGHRNARVWREVTDRPASTGAQA
jgi:hypothetical protein